jgi:hypothetical protein
MLSIEVLIPALHEELPLFGDDTPDSAEFSGCKTDAVLHTNWIEPKLSTVGIGDDLHSGG